MGSTRWNGVGRVGQTTLIACALTAITTQAKGQQIVALYRLDELTGTVAAETTCHQNDATYSGGVTLGQTGGAPGTGTAVHFDGVDGHAELADTVALTNLTSDFSVAAWIQPDQLSVWERIFGNQLSWAFGLQNDRLLFTTRGVQDFITQPAVSLDTWHHVAVTFDDAFDATFYVDGVNIGKLAGSSAANAPAPQWYVGAMDDAAGSGGGNGEHFFGFIDEVQVYAGTLTDTQVLQLYENPGVVISDAPVYCTAKTNSCGSVPAIGSLGLPSATMGTGFTVFAENARAGKHGLVIYSDSGPGNLPFYGGTLCIDTASFGTTPTVRASGSGANCDGVLSIDMNAFATGALGGTPKASMTVMGTQINCQFWARDTKSHGSLVTDALEYVVCP